MGKEAQQSPLIITVLLWWTSVPKFTGRLAGIKVLCKHSLFWPRPVAYCLFQPEDLMTKLKNEWMMARILETQDVTEPPHSAWKPLFLALWQHCLWGLGVTVLAQRSKTVLRLIGKTCLQEAESPPRPDHGPYLF